MLPGPGQRGVSGCWQDGVRGAAGASLAVRALTPPSLPQDVDECETEVCPGENEQCENIEGSYRCVCTQGYKQIEGVCVKEQIPGEPPHGPQNPGEGRSSSGGGPASPFSS